MYFAINYETITYSVLIAEEDFFIIIIYFQKYF